ncbi:MAG: chorismate synthase [Candidatus Hodarchaeota archaeon]
MGDNTFGNVLKVTTFGESHGEVIGVIVDGIPAGLDFNLSSIQKELDLRKPGLSYLTSSRKEPDKAIVLSGIFNNKTTGAPVCLIIENKDRDSSQYEKIKNLLRPSQTDFSSFKKFGGFADYRGSGHFSGRVSASFVMAGALAKQVLMRYNIMIFAYTKGIGSIVDEINYEFKDYENLFRIRESSLVKALNTGLSKDMVDEIEKVKNEGNSVGGLVKCVAINFPPGIGGPIFNSIESNLSKAIFAIPAIKGIEFGAGFNAAQMKGSEHNDPWILQNGKILTEKNDSGGIIGGISIGMPIEFTVAVKPTPSIKLPQKTINIKTMEEEIIQIEGRHDPCIVPRIIVVIEAMTAIVLLDYLLVEGKIPSIL